MTQRKFKNTDMKPTKTMLDAAKGAAACLNHDFPNYEYDAAELLAAVASSAKVERIAGSNTWVAEYCTYSGDVLTFSGCKHNAYAYACTFVANHDEYSKALPGVIVE